MKRPTPPTRDLRVLYFPPFTNAEELSDHLARAAWYLGCIHAGEIVFPLAPGLGDGYRFVLPEYLDESVLQAYRETQGSFHLGECADPGRLKEQVDRARVIMQWRTDPESTKSLQQLVGKPKEKKSIWRVDLQRSRLEGSLYIKAGIAPETYPEADEEIAECRKKFRRMAAQLQGLEKSFLFLTGPTSARYRDFDYSGGLPIICNSIIFDDEMVDHLRPKIIAFGDSIFHFGVSRYAAAFRRKLLSVLERHPMHICIPFNHYRLFTHHFPQLKGITIGIPFDYQKPVNLDLTKGFYLNPYKNILLMLMLPLATTLSRQIHLVGADGRLRADDAYFWNFNEKTQIGDKMANIRQAHPAFFDLDYNEYYDEHVAALADFCLQGEKAGKTIRSLTPSYIPCLRSRFAATGSEHETPFFPLVTVVMPCHNNGATLEAAVASVLQQDYPNWELVIVDEASDSATQQALQRAAVPDGRIRIVHKEKKNAAAARNRGIAEARGEYIAFLDADDIYYPRSLRLRMDALVLNHYDAVCCPTQMLDEKLGRMGWVLRIADSRFSFRDLNRKVFHISSLIIRRHLLLQQGGFDESDDFFAIEDLDLLQRLTRAGVEVWNVPEAETGYRQNPNGAVFRDYHGHSARVSRLWDIIFSEDPRVANPVPEYRLGLGSAEKQYIQAKRTLQAVTWLIVDRQAEKIPPLSQSASPRIVGTIRPEEMRDLIRAVLARHQRRPRSEWGPLFLRHKDDFIRAFTANRLLPPAAAKRLFNSFAEECLPDATTSGRSGRRPAGPAGGERAMGPLLASWRRQIRKKFPVLDSLMRTYRRWKSPPSARQ